MQRAAIYLDSVYETKIECAVVVAHLVWNAFPTKVDTIFGARSIEESRWHEWEQNKTNNCQSSHRCKSVAPLTKHIGSALEQQNKNAQCHKEMCCAVIRVHDFDEPNMGEEEILNRFFVVEAECALDADDAYGIGEGVKWHVNTVDERRPKSVSNQRVCGIKHSDNQRLFPPQCAMVARHGNCWLRAACHIKIVG